MSAPALTPPTGRTPAQGARNRAQPAEIAQQKGWL
jgi:hypothetical protein